MESFLFVILIVATWIALNSKMNKLLDKIQGLQKEINKLQKTTVAEKTVQPKVKEQEQRKEEPDHWQPKPEEPVVENEKEITSQPVIVVQATNNHIPKTPISPVATPAGKTRKPINYEKYIGENLFGKIGILILVVGMGLFVKYAIDNEWINETLRTILGFAVGGALLLVAERLQKKYRTFSSLLTGGAFAIFYVTVAIAFHYYALFSQTTAFIVLIVLTLFMSLLAILYNRRELAIISLVGGFFAPFLVSSGEGNYVVLFTYMVILNLSMFGLSVYKKWAELPVISFAFTWLIMAVYLLSGSAGATNAFQLFLFATFFYLIFLLPIISILQNSNTKITRLLLSIVAANNFIYMAFGLCFLNLMNTEYKLSGLLTLFVAFINLTIILWLKKQKIDSKLLFYTLLGVVITFVSITIPLQLNGNYITLFWASETLLLLWLFTRSKIRIYEYFSALMLLFTLLSYLMDITNAIDVLPEMMFFNGNFATNLFVCAIMLAYALLLKKEKELFTTTHIITYQPFNAITLLIACFVGYYAFMFEFYQHIADTGTSQIVSFSFTSATLLVLTRMLKKRFPFDRYKEIYLAVLIVNTLIFPITYLFTGSHWTTSTPAVLCWLFFALITTHIVYLSRLYFNFRNYRLKESGGFIVIINVLSIILLITATSNGLNQMNLDEFSAGFSIILTVIGFAQMILGMKLHLKIMRIISLITFGIVLLKLIFIDLWLLPTVGKIIVFIILGIILLTLSFLYQKLKTVLFGDEGVES